MKKQKTTEWQYEWVNPEGKVRWITEDDERSASWKAKKNTGRIRSREVVIKKSKWTSKEQDQV